MTLRSFDIRHSTFVILSLLALTLFAARADDLAPATTRPTETDYTNPHPERYLFEDHLKPGMKGYGLTVMHGSKIERFDFEILDVMKNFAPGQNEILVKCSGLGLEESGIIAGMSGSPCYIDGKLIGAIAYGWSASKQPIGGIQPIRQMLSIPADPTKQTAGAAGSAGAKSGAGAMVLRSSQGHAVDAQTGTLWPANSPLAQSALARPGWSALAKHLIQPAAPQPAAAPRRASLTPLATPLMVSGSSPQSLAYMQSMFAGSNFIPLQSGAAGSATAAPRLGGLADTPDEKLKLAPGSAIAIPMVSGDIQVAAIGTVTEVVDNKIWAFGHDMLGDGPTTLPIATSYIYSVIPSLDTSMKLGTAVSPAGALAADELTGIVGFTGATPATIPVALTLISADGAKSTLHFQVVQHPRATPEFLGTALQNALTSQRNLPKEFTLDVTASAQFTGHTIPLRSLTSSDRLDLSDILLPIATLTQNPYQNLKLEKLDLTATITPHNSTADIRRIHLNRLSVAPGGSLTATIDFAAFQKPIQSQTLTINIPADAPEGDFQLLIGSAGTMLKNDIDTTPHIADPENIAALLTTVQHITTYKDDHLYARLVLDLSGAAIAGRPRPTLPASRIALLSSDRQTGITPIIRTLTTEAATDALFTDAEETLHITITKDADKRYREDSTDITPTEPHKPPTTILPQKPSQPSPME